jgi:ABC-type nickel/cobalt efflux system permease component RcnA
LTRRESDLVSPQQSAGGLVIGLVAIVTVLFLLSLLVGRGMNALQPAWWYQLIASPGLL